MEKKDNVVACTKVPKNVREKLWKLFKEKGITSFVNFIYRATYNNIEIEDKVKIFIASNDKGINIGAKKDQ